MDKLFGEPVIWSGVDSSTPDGFTVAVVEVLGLMRTYLLRDGNVVGRAEAQGGRSIASIGDRVLGGQAISFSGFGSEAEALQAIADRL